MRFRIILINSPTDMIEIHTGQSRNLMMLTWYLKECNDDMCTCLVWEYLVIMML